MFGRDQGIVEALPGPRSATLYQTHAAQARSFPACQPAPGGAYERSAPEQVPALDYGPSFAQMDQINVIPLHDAGVYGADPPTALPGFPSRDELIARYADKTGRDLSALSFYRSFNSWK